MTPFLRDEMEMSSEHQLKLFQLELGNTANSRMEAVWKQGFTHHGIRVLPIM